MMPLNDFVYCATMAFSANVLKVLPVNLHLFVETIGSILITFRNHSMGVPWIKCWHQIFRFVQEAFWKCYAFRTTIIEPRENVEHVASAIKGNRRLTWIKLYESYTDSSENVQRFSRAYYPCNPHIHVVCVIWFLRKLQSSSSGRKFRKELC